MITGRPHDPRYPRYENRHIKYSHRQAARKAEERDIMSVATLARVRHGIALSDAPNALAGHPIGRLRLAWLAEDKGRGISRRQLEAAEAYQKIIYAHAGIMGLPMPNVQAQDLTGIHGGSRPEPDEKTIFEIRGRFRDARRLLLDAGAQIGVGSRVNAIVYAVVVEERDERTLSEDEIGILRCGLNALDRGL